MIARSSEKFKRFNGAFVPKKTLTCTQGKKRKISKYQFEFNKENIEKLIEEFKEVQEKSIFRNPKN